MSTAAIHGPGGPCLRFHEDDPDGVRARDWIRKAEQGAASVPDDAVCVFTTRGEAAEALRHLTRAAASDKEPKAPTWKATEIGLCSQEEKQGYQTPLRERAWYVVSPCLVFLTAFGLQSVLLHVTTHLYIVYMEHRLEQAKSASGQLYDLVGSWVGSFVKDAHGNVDVPLGILDATGSVPLALCLLSYVVASCTGTFSIGHWNKTFLVASTMALLKGVFDVVTIMPDSVGWQDCKERLSSQGVSALRHLTFQHFGEALVELLKLEMLGAGPVRRLRYCGDMMLSGHTYFAFIFCYSAYMQTRYTLHYKRVHYVVARVIKVGVFLICCVCLSLELVLVALARFHYTVDMVAAVVLVWLLFDSACMTQLASDWSEGFHWRDPEHFCPRSAPFTSLVLRLMGRPPDRNLQRVVPSKCEALWDLRALRFGVPAWGNALREATCEHAAPHAKKEAEYSLVGAGDSQALP